jgi:hypothetical protein
MQALHMNEVIAPAGNLSDQARRCMKVGPTWSGAKTSNGEPFPMFAGGQPPAYVGGEHRHPQTPGGHPARDFFDMSLDATEERRKARGDHGHA